MELSILFLRSSILGESNNLGVSIDEIQVRRKQSHTMIRVKEKTTGIQ